MFGYVVIDKPNILIKDFQTYRSYYCGLCKTLGHEFGTLLRFTLNYDIVFLALLGHNYENITPDFCEEHCITHPVTKVPSIRRNSILERVAYINIILGYYKAEDDVLDEKRHRAWKGLLFPKFKKAVKRMPVFAKKVQEGYTLIRQKEQQKAESDILAELFGNIMMASADALTDKVDANLRRLLFYAGKWVYLIDAMDDIKEDALKKRYNPFLTENSDFSDIVYGEAEKKARVLLYDCIDRMIESYQKMEITISEGALSNIIYRGFKSRTEQILSAKGEKCKKIRL